MKNYIYITLVFFFGCKPNTNKELTAQEIINKSISISGANKIANATISFNFRDKNYKAIRKNGNYQLEKRYDSIKDVLSNDGFKRYINGELLSLEDKKKTSFSNSVNSVHYFSVLPFGLNDKAVNKKLLASKKINEKDYYKVEVTFSKDGGGEDFEDVFIYWIDKKSFLIDYLAYSYHTNGGGKRFRAIKEQTIKKGIRFVNYSNYKPLDQSVSLIDIDKAFENKQLKKVSEINLKNIEVTLN